MMNMILWLVDRLNTLGYFLPQLILRIFLAWEFGKAGWMKYQGNNWFDSISDKFIFPFNYLPVEVNWYMAMGFELVGAVALVFGFFTRFFAATLMILTVVAIISVHLPPEWWQLSLHSLWMGGYDICSSKGGNFKLPLIYFIMLLPLLLSGAGRLSIDHWLWYHYGNRSFPHDIHK